MRSREYNKHLEEIKCAPGIVAVEMARKGQGILAQVDDGQDFTEIGRVVGRGLPWTGVYLGRGVVSDPGELAIGDEVLVRPDRGFVVNGFGWDIEGTATVRFFGTNGGPGSRVPFTRYAFDEGIMGKITGETLRAVGKRVTVRMGEIVGDVGGILLTDRSKKRDPVCEVVSVGASVTMVKPGDRIVVCGNSIFELDGEVKMQDLGSIHEDAILAVQ